MANATPGSDYGRNRLLKLLDMLDLSEAAGHYFKREFYMRGLVDDDLSHIRLEDQRLAERASELQKLRVQLNEKAAELAVREN